MQNTELALKEPRMTGLNSAISETDFEKPSSISLQVYEKLRSLILANQLKPGEIIIAEKLARQWEISRTPVRDALLRLEKDRLVVPFSNKGFQISLITKEEIINLYQVREALEVMAIEVAAPFIPDQELDLFETQFVDIEKELSEQVYTKYIPSDEQFHGMIRGYIPNKLLSSMLEGINDQITRIRNVAHTAHGPHMYEAFKEHKVILEALKQRNIEAARSAMRIHLHNVRIRTLPLLTHE
jgi:GntR family transcriptional regulator, rspAB operon transcriptional repressor